MSTLTQTVNAMRRPKLLLQAVRHGLDDYNRDRSLRRILRCQTIPGPARAVASLLLAEELLETARLSGDASYSPSRHVETMVALIAETRTLSSETARANREAAQEEDDTRRAAIR